MWVLKITLPSLKHLQLPLVFTGLPAAPRVVFAAVVERVRVYEIVEPGYK